MKHKGFTLLELLVTISIVGILVAVLAASFTTAQKRSRDAKRRADLQAVQKSLEQCFILESLYPLTDTVVFGNPLVCATQTTMTLLPVDPKNSATYVYSYNVSASQDSYCLCALLEKTGDGNANSAGASGLCSYTAQDYQCVSNQQ